MSKFRRYSLHICENIGQKNRTLQFLQMVIESTSRRSSVRCRADRLADCLFAAAAGPGDQSSTPDRGLFFFFLRGIDFFHFPVNVLGYNLYPTKVATYLLSRLQLCIFLARNRLLSFPRERTEIQPISYQGCNYGIIVGVPVLKILTT